MEATKQEEDPPAAAAGGSVEWLGQWSDAEWVEWLEEEFGVGDLWPKLRAQMLEQEEVEEHTVGVEHALVEQPAEDEGCGLLQPTAATDGQTPEKMSRASPEAVTPAIKRRRVSAKSAEKLPAPAPKKTKKTGGKAEAACQTTQRRRHTTVRGSAEHAPAGSATQEGHWPGPLLHGDRGQGPNSGALAAAGFLSHCCGWLP